MPLKVEYLPLSTLDRLPELEEALKLFLGRDPVVLGHQKAYIARLRNSQDQQVAEFLAYFWLMGLLGHFRQRLL